MLLRAGRRARRHPDLRDEDNAPADHSGPRERARRIARPPARAALVSALAVGAVVALTPTSGAASHIATGFAFLGMQLDVKGPTFAGDTIHVECEVTEARLSESRPGRGIVRTRNKVMKNGDTLVLEYTPLRMIKCRGQGAQ